MTRPFRVTINRTVWATVEVVAADVEEAGELAAAAAFSGQVEDWEHADNVSIEEVQEVPVCNPNE